MPTIEVTSERRSALDRYLALDLGAHSPAAEDLYARADKEARSADLALTGADDQVSPHLTSAMSSWLAAHVSRIRQGALAAVESVAARYRFDGGLQGIVAGVEHDRNDRWYAQRRTEETKLFYEQHQGKISAANKVEQEYLLLRNFNGGREARTPSLWIDLAIPVAIAVPEFVMNYASFAALAGVPAVGFGLSTVVAAAVALSAFMTGTFVKAYSFYMHSDQEERRGKGLRQVGIAAGILLVVMGAVAYARYHMVLVQWQAAIALGLTPPNVVALTLGLLAGNLLVFALGAGVTFMVHDENPDFARTASQRRTLKAEVEQLRRRVLGPKLRSAELRHKQERTRIAAMERLMDAQPDSHLIDEMTNDIAGKDAEVKGLLGTYRALLVEKLAERDPDFAFKGPATERYSAQGAERVSLSEFASLPLHLYRCHG